MKNLISNPKNLSIMTIVVSLISIILFFISRLLIINYSTEETFLYIITGLIVSGIGFGIISNIIYFLKLTVNKKYNMKKLNIMYFIFLIIQMLYSLLLFDGATIFIAIIDIILIYFLWILFFKDKQRFFINPKKIFYIVVLLYVIAIIFSQYLSYDESLYKVYGIKHIIVNLSYILMYLNIIPSTRYFSLYAEYKMKRGGSNE